MTDQSTLARFSAAVETLRAETWAAWKLGERESYPLQLHANTLSEALSQALSAISWRPGDRLAVQHSHAGTRKHTLRLYTVKKTNAGFWREATNGGRKVFVPLLVPTLDFQTSLAAPFAPVEAFDAFRDDPVGRDLQLVEARHD